MLVVAGGIAGCGRDAGPRRVPDDGAPCSAVMPGAPTSGDETVRLGTIAVTERAWALTPPAAGVDPPKGITSYVVRRGVLPPGAAMPDAALLDAAAARVARGVALQIFEKPKLSKVPTDGGEAVELRWTTGTSRNASRLLLIPGGYCEVTILGARSEADVAAYFASVQTRPVARK